MYNDKSYFFWDIVIVYVQFMVGGRFIILNKNGICKNIINKLL